MNNFESVPANHSADSSVAFFENLPETEQNTRFQSFRDGILNSQERVYDSFLDELQREINRQQMAFRSRIDGVFASITPENYAEAMAWCDGKRADFQQKFGVSMEEYQQDNEVKQRVNAILLEEGKEFARQNGWGATTKG